MKKSLMAAVGGVAAGVLVTTQLAAPLVAQEAEEKRSTYEQLDLFGDIFERVRSGYVEDVDEADLIESAINGMLNALDPHSSYLPPQDFDDMRVETSGEFGGLGIEVTQENGFVKVVSPIDDTPAAEAGVLAGDFITHVDGEPLLGLTLDESVDLMRGPVGSDIEITIAREDEDEPIVLTIVRDVIKVAAVRSRVVGDTVVLRISSFTEQTFDNLEEEIAEQVAELGGMEQVGGFVLDLRNNPGGLLNQAILVSDAFLDAGEVVSTRGRNAGDSERYNATPGDLAEGKPVVVLINGGSASASEIVAGALQDHQRGIVVGTPSFGKGSVQTIVPLQGGGAMRLTTARYYTPSGRSIQALGVAPDILVEQRFRDPDAIEEGDLPELRSEADLRGALGNDSLTEDERKQLEEERAEQEEIAERREEDYQLAYALDIIKGLRVLERD
ncbi:S41 family peptidase [Oceanomicrobium pacificus]|uniref:PDZ domain-containing protein n=1 Tax=Oceanomicrobium pacificus TaxID=2692916 RepID=A0A6B0TKH1_9RHOB|nr:S41 family peptidase [Oceanomicrobium pacificus]MXU64967.1 PDZ domain-containing protein [Oceanomicrobium pacificus]